MLFFMDGTIDYSKDVYQLIQDLNKGLERAVNYLFTVYADESFANVAFDQCQIALNAKPVSAITNDKRSFYSYLGKKIEN